MLCGDLNRKEVQRRGNMFTRVAGSLGCRAETSRALLSTYSKHFFKSEVISLQKQEVEAVGLRK